MEQAIQKIAFQWITALIWTVVVDTATRMSWLQETDIDFANRSRDWLSLARPLWAGPARWFPIEACLRLDSEDKLRREALSERELAPRY